MNNENLKDLTNRRKFYLRKMFSNYNIDITGNPEFPTLLLDNNKLLYTYIKNFELNFLDDLPSTGYIPKTVKSFKIKNNVIIDKDDEFLNNYFMSYWKRIYTIRHIDTSLYLTGYCLKTQLLNKEKELSPVFGLIQKKYFFNKEHADLIVEKYPNLKLIVD